MAEAPAAAVGSRRHPVKSAAGGKRSKRIQDAPRPPKLVASRPSKHLLDHGSWAELDLDERVVRHVEGAAAAAGGKGLGFSRPTRVQELTIPTLLAGRDMMVRSETGSGKTLAFLIPIVHSLVRAPRRISRGMGTFAVVLAPTRELCSQIADVLARLVSPFPWLVPTSLSGGEKRKAEKARLRRGATIVVSTPGRLLDHLQHTQSFRRDRLRWLVLDEADRLLDLGFEQQVRMILQSLTPSGGAGKPAMEGGDEESGSGEEGEEESGGEEATAHRTLGTAASPLVPAPDAKSGRQTVLCSATITYALGRRSPRRP